MGKKTHTRQTKGALIMSEFLAMGGYAFYVWSAFGLTALVIIIAIFEPFIHHQNALKQADDFHSDESN